MSPLRSGYVAWGVWLVSWLIAARWSARVERRPIFGSQSLYHLPTFIGVALLFTDTGAPHRINGGPGWLLFTVVLLGFGFCWWARLHLGAMWSSTVTRKEGHHIVDSGPYGLVRHPIYTGLILSAFAQAVLHNEPRAYLGAALMTLGFFIKARLEESFLRQELGPDAYDPYRARTPMLVPWKLFGQGR